MKARKTAILSLGILATICLAPDANAQMVKAKARDKVQFYSSPHELQIIDDRPIIKDFREAPSAPEQIQLPPPPQGFGGPGGGGGGGAMGDGGGGANPGGGVPAGPGGGPGYRTNGPMMGSPLPLEHSGFGNHTNIPAGGMAPKTMLPSGQTTGIHGTLMTPTAHSAPAGAGAGPRAASAMPVRAATPVASYGNTHAAPSGGSSGSGGGANTSVQGKLLNRLK